MDIIQTQKLIVFTIGRVISLSFGLLAYKFRPCSLKAGQTNNTDKRMYCKEVSVKLLECCEVIKTETTTIVDNCQKALKIIQSLDSDDHELKELMKNKQRLEEAFQKYILHLWNLNRHGEGMEWLRRVIKVMPQSVAYHQYLRGKLKDLNKLPEGAQFELKVRPGEKHFRYAKLGTEYFKKRDIQNAIFFLSKVLQIKERGIYYKILSRMYRYTEQPQKVIDYQNESRKLLKLGIVFSQRGMQLYDNEQYQQAQFCLRWALEFQPHTASLYHNLAFTLHRSGKYQEAITYYKKTIQCGGPELQDQFYGLGKAYYALGNLEQAIKYLNKSIEAGTVDEDIFEELGCYYNLSEDLDKALEFCRKSIQIHPRCAGLHYLLGIAYRSLQNMDQAINSFHRAIELNFQESYVYCLLGRALKEKGKVDEGISVLQKYLQLNPTDSYVFEYVQRLKNNIQ